MARASELKRLGHKFCEEKSTALVFFMKFSGKSANILRNLLPELWKDVPVTSIC